jgi:hypothetical protein
MTPGQKMFGLSATQIENFYSLGKYFEATHDERWKIAIIYLVKGNDWINKLNKSTSETPGAQLHKLNNIPIKYDI